MPKTHKKRKHRVVVELTFNKPHGQKEARRYVQGVLEGYFKLPGHKTSGVTKFATKEGERVIRTAVLKETLAGAERIRRSVQKFQDPPGGI